MIYILIVIFTLFLFWTLLNSLFMPRLPKGPYLKETPLVSVLVPLRNEQRNVRELIASLRQLTYPNLEVILLEDHSSDDTFELLLKYTEDLPNFRVIQGDPLPSSWVGKVFGCHQLSEHAKGEYLLFIDADVRLRKDTIEATVALAKQKQAGLVTGFPQFPTDTFLGNLVIPMQHFVVFFHLPLFMANLTNKHPFTAAHGAFMFFDKKSYNGIDGHRSVQSSLVEDVEISRTMKKVDQKVLLANITDYVTCHMYTSSKEVWQGFTKNMFPGLGRSYLFALFVSAFYFTLGVVPLIFAGFGFMTMNVLYALPLLLILTQRLVVDRLTRMRMPLFLLMPLSALSLVIILQASMLQSLLKKGYEWKGRRYS